nr:nucleic acid binding protein [Carrot virus S]
MHYYNFQVLCVLNKAEPRLPAHIVEIIFEKSHSYRRDFILSLNKPRGCGTSKSAVKRRAQRFNRCANCGKYAHEGKCKWATSQSDGEFAELIRIGAINYCNERPIRKNSMIETTIKLERIRLHDYVDSD